MPDSFRSTWRARAAATGMAAWLAVSACGAARAQTFGAAGDPPAIAIDAMLDCRLWSTALGGCVRLPAGAGPALPENGTPSGSGPDYAGIKRDTYYFLGLQLSIIGVLYLMPESVSGWSDEQKEQHRASKWWNNVSNPTWDSDDDYINYVLHPYWGAAYYVRARERGYDSRGAFWYSFLLSTLYEGGVEALFEPISIQDFFVTPIAGAWLGHYFMDWRQSTQARIASRGETRFRDRALLVATDPLGSAADFVDRRLGRAVEFRAAPFISAMPSSAWQRVPGAGPHERETVYGVTLNLRW